MTVPLNPMSSPENLTRSLRDAGVLEGGRVRSVWVLGEVVKQRSHTIRLRLDVEGPGVDTPASVVLKTGRLNDEGRPAYANEREVAFYREIAPLLPGGLVPRCYQASDATSDSVWRLTLEDLTDSHVQASRHPLPPPDVVCEAVVCRWAAFHAACWDKQRFGTASPAGHARQALSQANAAKQFALFVDRFPDLLSRERRQLFERLLDKMPALLVGAVASPLTLTHGDAHWWNCLVPRPGKAEGVCLLDWEDWGIGKSATDMAYMMSMMWYPDLRHRSERPLLRRYHAELLARDVTEYQFDALDQDYRSAVLLLMLRPVLQAASAIPPRVWWPNLERVLMAVDDLDCEGLLD